MPVSPSRPTIKDVARAAGVGVVTVSRALNDKPDVSPATRKRILAIASDLGYRPNRHARFLKMSHNPTIALMMKGVDNPFFQRMLDIMETIVRKHEYLLTIVKVPHWADEIEEAVKLADDDFVAGVIFLGGSFAHEASAFEKLSVPFVLSTVSHLDGVPDALYSSVSVDDRFESARAVRHLLDLGHTQIAVLAIPPDDTSVGALRLLGYRDALNHAGVPIDEELIRYESLDRANPYTFEHGYHLAQSLLIDRPDATAIFAVADVLAIGAMRAIREAGLRIPQDMSIVGFDGISVGDFVDPALTTLAQSPEEIAELTCEILFNRIDSGPVQHVFIPGRLHEGASTAPARVTSHEPRENR